MPIETRVPASRRPHARHRKVLARLGSVTGCAAVGCSLVLAGCGSSHHTASPPATGTAAAATTTIPATDTVAGMHFVPMRSEVDPVVMQLETGLAHGTIASPDGRTLGGAEAALKQFDSSAPSFGVTGGTAAHIDDVLGADRRLLTDLEAVGAHHGAPSTVTLKADLTAWTSAVNSAAKALGLAG